MPGPCTYTAQRLLAFIVLCGLSCAHARPIAPSQPIAAPAAAAQAAELGLAQSIPQGLPLRDPALPTAAEVWRELFRGARTHIEMEQFYVQSDAGEALAPILDELQAAAGRGVRVRIVLSTALRHNDRETQERLKAVPGIEVRYLDLSRRTGGIVHAKYLLIDDELLYIGSQNFDWRSLSQIHELGVRIRSAALAAQLARIFALDWELAAADPQSQAPPPAPVAAAPLAAAPLATEQDVELVASPPPLLPTGTRPAIEALVELLREARHSVSVQLLKYSPFVHRTKEPWLVIDRELRAAAGRGVNVQLLVSNWNTTQPAIAHLKELTQVPGIAVRIVNIPELQGRFIPHARVIHSKYLIVDERILWLGTANWEPEMFLGSRNVELIIRRPAVARQGSRIFQTLWSSPYAVPVDPQKEYTPPRIK